jgi:glycosyltransferase involved in cell wall biosynthesis
MSKNVMKKKVSIIICSYNEKETVTDVVKSCRRFNEENEIIVVDDGSDDCSPDLLKSLEKEITFQNIRLPKNQGKSNAMVTGVKKASHEIILFFDADVSGIRKEHFERLLNPMTGKEPEADMVLGTPSETLINYRINPFKSLTGERTVFKKDLLPILDDIREIRFGVESYINLYYQAHGKTIKYILLDGLIHPTTFGKTTPGEATMNYLLEAQQITKVYLENHDLITKRIGTSFKDKSAKIKENLKKIQAEINEKIQVLLRHNG